MHVLFYEFETKNSATTACNVFHPQVIRITQLTMRKPQANLH